MRCRVNQRLQEKAKLDFIGEAKKVFMTIAALSLGIMLLFSTIIDVKIVAIIFSVISLLFFVFADNMLCLFQHEAQFTKTRVLKGTSAYIFTIVKDIFFIAVMWFLYMILHNPI